MSLKKTSQQKSQRRFVISLAGLELVVCVLFCVYVRYDDSLNAVLSGRRFDRADNSSHTKVVLVHEDNYPRKKCGKCCTTYFIPRVSLFANFPPFLLFSLKTFT
jgi:hypothetical protein